MCNIPIGGWFVKQAHIGLWGKTTGNNDMRLYCRSLGQRARCKNACPNYWIFGHGPMRTAKQTARQHSKASSQRDPGRLLSDRVVQAPERRIGEATPREETTFCFPPIRPSFPPAERRIVPRLL